MKIVSAQEGIINETDYLDRAVAIDGDALFDWAGAQITKVSVRLVGHATSFTIERSFLSLLKCEAQRQKISFAKLVSHIDGIRPTNVTLSTALRFYAFQLTKAGRR